MIPSRFYKKGILFHINHMAPVQIYLSHPFPQKFTTKMKKRLIKIFKDCDWVSIDFTIDTIRGKFGNTLYDKNHEMKFAYRAHITQEVNLDVSEITGYALRAGFNRIVKYVQNQPNDKRDYLLLNYLKNYEQEQISRYR